MVGQANLTRAPHRAALAREMLAAAAALQGVVQGTNLPDALARALAQHLLPGASRAPVHDMAYAAVRRLGTARAVLARLAPRAVAPPLAALLQIALVQLFDPLRAQATIVDQAVSAVHLSSGGVRSDTDAAGRVRVQATARFANAVLRRFLRERDGLMAAVVAAAQQRDLDLDWPDWWVRQLQADHPEHWREVLAVSAKPPPMTLRVDLARFTVPQYLAMLADTGIAARQIGMQAVRLEQARAVERVPGFVTGWVSVQDAGAQLAAPLLGVRDGHRVLDACAAPGGKTVHLLELADIDLWAVDVDATRLQKVAQNLHRGNFSIAGAATQGGRRQPVRLVAGDAGQPQTWWDGAPFDRILLDAPCSASGIVRRHPDIRWLRRRGDLATLAAAQGRLLEALWPLLAPGGRLLYVTCSLFVAENEAVVSAFVERTSTCRRQPIRWDFSAEGPEPVGQILPLGGEQREHDGFFYALLERIGD